MKNTPSKTISLTGTVVSILLVTTILIQAAMGGIFYFRERSGQYRDLQIQLQQVVDQAKNNLENPLWNFDNEQIGQILHNFMLIPTVERVTVKNSSGTTLFDQIQEKSGNTGKFRLLSENRKIFKGSEQLGSVEVSLSTDQTNQGLRHYLISIFFSILILTLVQIATLYLLLRKTIINPLKTIESYAGRVTSHTATLPDFPKGRFTGELRNLRNSVIAMVTAMHNSEKSYRSIFENSLEGIFQTSPDGQFIKVNSALADILGYDSLEELNATRIDIARELHIDNNRRKELLDTVKIKGFVRGQEVALRHKDGHTLHCLISMHAIRNNAGEIILLEGSLINISKRKHAEEQLANLNQHLEILVEQRTEQLNRRNEELVASEGRYRKLVETMQEGILVIDETGRVTYVNQQMESMLGSPPDELVGRACTDLIETRYQEIFTTKIKEANSRFAAKLEMNFTRSDGHVVSTIVTPTPLFNENGRYSGAFAVVTDITSLKHLQAQLLNAQKLEAVGQLAAGIAHEINTPTQYITNNARFLEDAFKEFLEILAHYESLYTANKTGIPAFAALEAIDASRENHQIESLFEEIPEAFHDTFEGLARISSIVSSIKRFSHPCQDVATLADLNDAIRTTITISTNEWKYVAEVDTDLDPALPPVPCDVSAINQVVLNLIVNAAQAIADKIGSGTSGKGTITLQTRNCNNYAEIRVSDTGIGIPENIRSRIFDPFFTTKEIGKGTGQGLAIARTIITETHHGSIDFESEAGLGTTFIIRLPLQEPA